MKVFRISLVLLMAGVCRGAAREALYPAGVDSNGEDRTLNPQDNYDGWVNPEDLPPMPQCITQQDQSAWLSTMTECTSKRCTRHFGFICTHGQWLTQLSCLSIGFSPDVIRGYLPYCSRSVLTKAQLYRWIHHVTARTWLVDVGDANELQNLSPASLAKGYAAVDVISHAPACLTGSDSALPMGSFQHIMASCSFTSTTQHTGNAARPWEYNEHLGYMTALDSETAGYDLIAYGIEYGNYFDRECFCRAFTIDPGKESCSEPGELDWTRERLWMSATCGPTSVPDNGTAELKTTDFAYIPIQDWHWPRCVTDMPKQLIQLPGQCATDACELDSSGYCRVVRAVGRACFCDGISYDSCGGSCHIFETRIDYVKWLHDLCGSLQDWHGLPDNWRQLTATSPLDMIPWRWTIKPSNEPSPTTMTRLGSTKATETCASTEWKLGSFALVNIGTFLATFLGRRTDIHRIARRYLWHLHPQDWVVSGILIAALQLLANWFNAYLVQKTRGYEDVPVFQLMLLWCSMPRLTWLMTLLVSVQSFESVNLPASSLLAETILQVLSSYYMIMTVYYGQEHSFYLKGMERLEMATPARFMYAGALLWLLVFILAFVLLIQATHKMNRSIGADSIDGPEWQRSKQTASSTRREGGNCTVYGTLPVERQNNRVSQKAFVKLHTATIMSMLLWIAQWLFWSGFIGLSLEEFCPPKLGVLTAVWIASDVVAVTASMLSSWSPVTSNLWKPESCRSSHSWLVQG